MCKICVDFTLHCLPFTVKEAHGGKNKTLGVHFAKITVDKLLLLFNRKLFSSMPEEILDNG